MCDSIGLMHVAGTNSDDEAESEVTKRQFSEICGIQTRIDFKAFAADIDLKHNENERHEMERATIRAELFVFGRNWGWKVILMDPRV